MMSPCFCILPASAIIGLGKFKGMSLLCNFNIHINCLWIWLASFWPCWCHLLLLPCGARSPRLSIPTIYFILILNWCFRFYCHQILAWQDLIKISTDSAFSDSNYTLCDFMNYNHLCQLIGNAIPSSFYFAPFMYIYSYVEDPGHEQHLTKKLFARTILQNGVRHIQFF